MVLEAIVAVFTALFDGLRWFVNQVMRTFPFSSPSKVFALAVILLLMSLGLIVWFGGSSAKSVGVGRPAEDAEAGVSSTITLSTSTSTSTSTTLDPCMVDLTCLSDPTHCEESGMQCCPAGSLGEYRCVDWGDPIVMCNREDITYRPLSELQAMPDHCGCSSDYDCVGDIGGSTCCLWGTAHFRYCYEAAFCNITSLV